MPNLLAFHNVFDRFLKMFELGNFCHLYFVGETRIFNYHTSLNHIELKNGLNF